MRRCAGRATSERNRASPRTPPPRRRSVEGPSFHRLLVSTDEQTPERRAERRIGSGGAANRQRRAAEATAVRSERGHRCKAAVFEPRLASSTGRCSKEHREVEVTARHTLQWRTARTSFERSTSDSLDCSQSTRAAEVEALVSTPLRRPRPDPGSGLVSGRCAPPLGETVETSTASAQAESASSVAFRDRLRTRAHPSSRRWMRLHRQPH